MTFHCDTCDREHDGLPDLGLQAPDPYLDVPEMERAVRTVFTDDYCAIADDDGSRDYFVRGVLYVPLRDAPGQFGLGLWVSQSAANFTRYVRGDAMESTTGWVANRLPHFAQSTFGLRARLSFDADELLRRRPTIALMPCDHILAVDAELGITVAQAWAIVHRYLPH